MCLSILKPTPVEYATNVFSSDKKNEQLAVVVHVLLENWSFHVIDLQRTATFQSLNKLAPVYLQDLFNKQSADYDLRNSFSKLSLPRPRINY